MKHTDGIGVRLQTPTATSLKEYDNPHEKRHSDFNGSLRSRLVVAEPGEPFEVLINIDKEFKPFSAAGLAIVLVVGDKTEHLSLDDNSQVWWLDSSRTDIRGEHRFSGFRTWKSNDASAFDKDLPLQMPTSHPAYATASSKWLDADMYEANEGCVAVWVVRGRLTGPENNGAIHDEHSITNPPEALRFIDTESPRVIRGEWFDPLLSYCGRPYVFEFRNMDKNIINQQLPEADPECGHDNFDSLSDQCSVHEPITDTDDRTVSWDEAEYKNANDFAEFHYSDFKGKRVLSDVGSSFRKSRKRQRAAGSIENLGMGNVSAISTNDHRRLPVRRGLADEGDTGMPETPGAGPPRHRESTSGQEFSMTQEPTPVPSDDEEPDDGNSAANSRVARTNIDVQLPSEHSTNVVDLTMEEENAPIKEEETPDHRAQAESEDEDFDLELRKIQIERDRARAQIDADYQLQKLEIEKKRRAKERKTRTPAKTESITR